ncbi:hypothetical protein KBI52_18200 [Microvirga sp. HBU67558]|uniref:hypothetical protein n=1 Tax=Microvirga TaxID=186650 RepID=UPI001B367FA6|nr:MULTISPECIES: hypothetical protein [unclassified Microvirga]MBQ0822125.1 hypothetical protein [Microvirga sp. HBU67558]
MNRRQVLSLFAMGLIAFWLPLMKPQSQVPVPDPLPSWNGGAAKQAIIDFVERATQGRGSDFVPVEASSPGTCGLS